jgi:hypothetical protein
VVRLLVALGAALLLALTVLTASPSQAVQRHHDRATHVTPRADDVSGRVVKCRPPNCWIAGAVNLKSGYAFLKYNTPSKGRAHDGAIAKCKRKSSSKNDRYCKAAGIQRSGCLTIAYRTKGSTFVEWSHGETGFNGRSTSATLRASTRIAKNKLKDSGRKHVWIRKCTGHP